MIANERFVKALIGVGGKYLKKRENFRIEDANSAKASDQIPVCPDRYTDTHHAHIDDVTLAMCHTLLSLVPAIAWHSTLRSLIHLLINQGNQKALKYAVRMKAMALVQSLGIGFQHDARHSIFYVEYQRLVAKGIQFPVHKPTDFAPITTPAPHGAAPAPVRHMPLSGPAPVPARGGGGAPNAVENFTVIKNNVTLLADMLRNNDVRITIACLLCMVPCVTCASVVCGVIALFDSAPPSERQPKRPSAGARLRGAHSEAAGAELDRRQHRAPQPRPRA